MYRVYDYECEICDKKEERLVTPLSMDNQNCDCTRAMIRLPANPITTFKHNDTRLKR